MYTDRLLLLFILGGYLLSPALIEWWSTAAPPGTGPT